MKRNVWALIVTVALTTVVTFPAQGVAYSYSKLDSKQIDQRITQRDEIQKILQKSYFHGKNVDIFSSATVLSNTPSLYYVYWSLKMMKELGFTKQDFDRVRDEVYNKLSFDSRLSEIENIRMFSEIQYMLGVPDDGVLRTKLFSHFNPKTGLFFDITKDDTMATQIYATSVAVDTIVNLHADQDLELIKQALLAAYADDRNFTYTSKEDNLINNGGVIISTLYKLGYTYALVQKAMPQTDRTQWFEYWSDQLYTNLGTDWGAVSVLKSMAEISQFFGRKITSNSSYLGRIFQEWKGIEGFGVGEGSYAIQPPYVEQILTLCKEFSYPFPYEKGLDSYLRDLMDSQFTKADQVIKNSAEDNYYGIALADANGFSYDKAKMTTTLQALHTQLVDEDSSISNREKLRELYYLILSYQERDLKFPKSIPVKLAVQEYLVNQDAQQNLEDNMQDLIFGCKIIQTLDGTPSPYLREQAKLILDNLQNSDAASKLDAKRGYPLLLDLITVTGTSEIYGQLKDVAITKVSGQLGNLEEVENGGVSLEYQRINSVLSYRSLLPNETVVLKTFLQEFAARKIFSNSVPPNSSTLRTLYEGSCLTTYYSRS